MSALVSSIRASMVRNRNAWWSVRRLTNACSNTPILAREHHRVAFPGQQCGQHLPLRHSEDVRHHRGEPLALAHRQGPRAPVDVDVVEANPVERGPGPDRRSALVSAGPLITSEPFPTWLTGPGPSRRVEATDG